MISNFTILLLALMVGAITCITYENRVTYYFKTQGNYLTQNGLMSADAEVIFWGQGNDHIKQCSYSNNQYFDTISKGEMLKRVIPNFESDHTHVMVQFDINHMKTVKGYNASTKKTYKIGYTVDSNPTDYINGGYYIGSNCIVNNQVGVDQKVTINKGYQHRQQTMTLQISADDLTQDFILGVANINIYQAKCGDNAEINPNKSKTECVCKEGYSIWNMSFTTTDSKGKQNTVYFHKCNK